MTVTVTVTAAVERALALSREMLSVARNGDWEVLAVLDAERLPLLREYCTRERAGVAVLDELRECNARIVALVEHAREDLARDWQQTRVGHQGARDYQRIARDSDALAPPVSDSAGLNR